MDKNVGSVDLQELMKAREELNREKGIETDPNLYKNYNPNRANDESLNSAESDETESQDGADVFAATESEGVALEPEPSEQTPAKNYDVYDNFSEFEINSGETSGAAQSSEQPTAEQAESSSAAESADSESTENNENAAIAESADDENSEEIDLDDFLKDISIDSDDISELEEYENNKNSSDTESESDTELNYYINNTISEIDRVQVKETQGEVPEPPKAILNSDPERDNYDSVKETLIDMGVESDYAEENNPYVEESKPYISTERVVDAPKTIVATSIISQEEPQDKPHETSSPEQPEEEPQEEAQDEAAEPLEQSVDTIDNSKEDGQGVSNLEKISSDDQPEDSEEAQSESADSTSQDLQEDEPKLTEEAGNDNSDAKPMESRREFSTFSFKREQLQQSNEAENSDINYLRTNAEPILKAQTQVSGTQQELPEQREDSYNNITEYSFVELSKSSEFERSQKMTYVFGKDEKNRTLYMSVKNMLNTAIFGTNNYYNFAQLASIMLSLAMKNSVDEINFVILDSNISSEFEIFNKSKYMFFNRVAKTNTEIYETLNELINELNDRYELLVNEGVRSIEQYNELKTDPADKLPNILIVYSNYTASAGQIFAKEIDEKLETLLKLGRIVGINLIISAYQQFDSELINYSLAGRIGFATKNEELSLYQVGSDNLTKLTRAGEFLYVSFEDDIEIHLKAPNLSVKEAAEILDKLEKN